VQVTDKNVELSGTVPNRDAKDKAEQIAKAHAGGLGVKNHLKVGGS
jgi:osmotically-inducible protein OsmY